MPRSRQVVLVERPVGKPRPDAFRVETVEVPEPAEGQALVRNTWMSVDPYMRGRMYDRASYARPFALGAPLEGGAVGEVVASRHPEFRVGDTVCHNFGWREYALVGETGSGVLGGAYRVDAGRAPAQAYLGILGMPGLTAYAGLLVHGRPQAGETVFVSAASGAVGSAVGQIARIQGCCVVGSAGGPDKVRHVVEDLGFDAAFDYRGADLDAELARTCPDGIDIYFDNVGGAQLEAALARMNVHGRVPVCGRISQSNATAPPPGPANLSGHLIVKRLSIRGFLVSDHEDVRPQFLADMTRWIAEGRVRYRETVHDGIESAPAAFIGLFDGENVGKMLVRLG
jgi:NADPH-dependent curcumin reductase CurA